MKQYLMMLVALMTTLFAANAMAFTPPAAPARGWYVVDQAGKLTPAQMDTINRKVLAISQVTKNEFGVVILQTLNGEDIRDAANATFKAWGIGKHGLDNGCLIMISAGDRKTDIETGKGVEGEVTDLQASDILTGTLRPFLRNGDYAGGILATLGKLDGLIESRHNQKATPRPIAAAPQVVVPQVNVPVATPAVAGAATVSSNNDGSTFLFAFIALVVVLGGAFLIWSWLDSRSREKERLATARRQRELAQEQALRAQAARNAVAQKAAASIPAPQNYVPTHQQHHAPVAHTPAPVKHTYVKPETYYTKPVEPSTSASDLASAAAAATLAAELEAAQQRREREREEERRARAREQEDEDRRRRQREDDDRRSSESSSSSWSSSDSGSSWGGGDSGGGFGGGDSGGGGSSSDF